MTVGRGNLPGSDFESPCYGEQTAAARRGKAATSGPAAVKCVPPPIYGDFYTVPPPASGSPPARSAAAPPSAARAARGAAARRPAVSGAGVSFEGAVRALAGTASERRRVSSKEWEWGVSTKEKID